MGRNFALERRVLRGGGLVGKVRVLIPSSDLRVTGAGDR